MKGLVLGALALATLVAAPAPAAIHASLVAGPFDAELVSSHMSADGRGAIELDGGGIVSYGAFEGEFFARVLTVESYRDKQTTLHAGGFQFTHHENSHAQVLRLTNASVTVRGDEDGILFVGLDGARARAELGPLDGAEVFASSSEWFYESVAARDAERGPLVGFKDDPERRLPSAHQGGGGLVPSSVYQTNFSFPEVPIEAIRFEDRPRLALDNGTILIEHDAGRMELRADRYGKDILALDRGRVITHALVPEAARGALTFANAGVAFVSPSTTLVVNGTVTIPAADGRIRLDGHRAIHGDTVSFEGDLRFALSPEPAASLGEPPRLATRGDGDAQLVRVNDAALSRALPAAAPPAKTFAEVAIGAALLLWLALSKTAVGLFIRDPYANPRRAAIIAAIRRARFRHLRGLQRDTGLPLGTLSYHLAVLRRTGAVRAIRCDNRDVYVLAESELSPSEAAALCVLASDTTARVAESLVRGGAGTQDEIAARLGLDRSTVSRHLRRLTKTGLARAIRGTAARYHAQPPLLRWSRSREVR